MELDAKGKPKAPPAAAKAAKGAPPVDDKCKGFVLDGFPRNARQAALMERALTGARLGMSQVV